MMPVLFVIMPVFVSRFAFESVVKVLREEAQASDK
jgi:hypothetical protein